MTHVLSTEPTYIEERCPRGKKIFVVVHLYYRQTISTYAEKIERIPEEIKVYIYSSDESLLKEISKIISRKEVFYFHKSNRGRDVSTLLVAARKQLLQADYFCFIHDKQENYPYLKEDVTDWVEGFWENLLANDAYICRVIQLFEKYSDVGLLVTPEPSGEFTDFWAKGTWYKDFENTKKLGDRLGLNVEMNEEIQVPGCGTVFWARTAALLKLLQYDWKYEDFPEEPMPYYGTLGHAVERILPFVAEDAGYCTEMIMTQRYISEKYSLYQNYAREMFSLLKERCDLNDMHQIMTIKTREKKIEAFIEASSTCLIYGCGEYGKKVLDMISRLKKLESVKGFLVSNGYRSEEMVYGLPVYEMSEIQNPESVSVIIGVHYEKRDEIEEVLKNTDFEHWIYGF